MSQTSILESRSAFAPRPRFGRTGLWLVAVLALALTAVGATAFMASSQNEHAATIAATTTAPATATEKSSQVAAATQPPLALPGFQRRGPLLTGEVKTQDGSTLRLVIDTRSHAIVGYRIVEPALAAGSPSR